MNGNYHYQFCYLVFVQKRSNAVFVQEFNMYYCELSLQSSLSAQT